MRLSSQSGFTLIYLSVLLLIAGILALAILPGGDRGSHAAKLTMSRDRIDAVMSEQRGFMAAYGRRPCPADPSLPVDHPDFGKEVGSPGTCEGLSLSAPGVAAGMIPTRTLNMPDSAAFDPWGRRYTYVVATATTNPSGCAALIASGGLAIRDTHAGKIIAEAGAAYISHGADAFGAFPAKGSTPEGRINNQNPDPDTRINAMVDAEFHPAVTREFVLKGATATFDDLVIYEPFCSNARSPGASAQTPSPPSDSPPPGDAPPSESPPPADAPPSDNPPPGDAPAFECPPGYRVIHLVGRDECQAEPSDNPPPADPIDACPAGCIQDDRTCSFNSLEGNAVCQSYTSWTSKCSPLQQCVPGAPGTEPPPCFSDSNLNAHKDAVWSECTGGDCWTNASKCNEHCQSLGYAASATTVPVKDCSGQLHNFCTCYGTAAPLSTGASCEGTGLANGQSAGFYSTNHAAAGTKCIPGSGPVERTCFNGRLTGDDTYPYRECTDNDPCEGTGLADGQSGSFWSKTLCSGSGPVERTCFNGRLTGDDAYPHRCP